MRKRSENKTPFIAKGKKGRKQLLEDEALTAHEREKIIEVLMSQERVLTLLYDKTFPPHQQQQPGVTTQLGGGLQATPGSLKNRPGTQSSKLLGLSKVGSIRQFNYQVGQEVVVDDEDEQQLEKEIEEALKRNAGSSLAGQKNNEIYTDIQTGKNS